MQIFFKFKNMDRVKKFWVKLSSSFFFFYQIFFYLPFGNQKLEFNQRLFLCNLICFILFFYESPTHMYYNSLSLSCFYIIQFVFFPLVFSYANKLYSFTCNEPFQNFSNVFAIPNSFVIPFDLIIIWRRNV